MNIAYKSISGIDFIYPEEIKDKAKYVIVLNCFIFLIEKKYIKDCKIQAIFVNYVSFMNLEGSTFTTFQNMKDIYNIYGYLKKQKTYNATDNFICKLLLRFKKVTNKTFKVRPKPK